MDPKNTFDELLKEKLHQHSEPVPGRVWEKIARDSGKKKAAFWRAGWALLLLAFISTAVFFMNENGKEQVLHSGSANLTDKSGGESSTGSNPVDENAKTAPQSFPSVSKAFKPEQKQHKENSVVSTTHKNAALPQATASTQQENKYKSNSKNKVVNSAADSKGMITAKDETAVASVTVITMDAASGSVEQSSANTLGKENNETTPETVALETDSNQSALPPSVIKDIEGNKNIPADSVAQDIKNDSATGQATEAAVPPMAYVNSHPVSIEVYILPENATKNLNEKPSRQEPDYLNVRKESETIDYAFSAGANLRYQLSSHYFVRVGARYSVINEKLDLKQSTTESHSSLDSTIRGYIIDPFLPAVPIYKYDSTSSEMTVTTSQAANNRYTFIDVPISAGYQLRFKKFDLYLSAGIEVNFLTHTSGKIAAESNNDLIDLDSGNAPFNKTSLSFQSGLGFTYHFSSSLELMVEPNFRKQLTTMTKDDYPLDQKYTRIGIMAGIKYNLR